MNMYYIMQAQYKSDYCVIDGSLEQLPKSHYPSLGKKMGKLYPPNITFEMAADFPGILVPDFIRNALGYPMVSNKMKRVLEENATCEIEFLRFTLLNHKRRKAGDDFYISNVIGTFDCVDEKKTVGEISNFKPDRYDYIESLFLNEEKIIANLNLFRISSFPSILIIRDDFKNILLREGISGMEFLEMGALIKLES